MTERTLPRSPRTSVAVASATRHTEVAIVVLLLLTIFAVAWTSGRADAAKVDTQRVRVQAGDTLWSMAKAHPVAGLTTAETVRLLGKINHLEDTHVAIGTSLEVPASPVRSSSALAMR